MTTSQSQPIMIVEDSDDDYEATERALKKDGRLVNPLIRFESAEDAVDYLLRRNAYADQKPATRPGIILLDLNMPGAGGHAVLKALRTSESLRDIPVVVLTTSNDPRDVKKSYAEGANSYVVKPVTVDGYFNAIRQLKEYWVDLSILPGEPS